MMILPWEKDDSSFEKGWFVRQAARKTARIPTKIDEFCIKTRNLSFKMMDFVLKTGEDTIKSSVDGQFYIQKSRFFNRK